MLARILLIAHAPDSRPDDLIAAVRATGGAEVAVERVDEAHPAVRPSVSWSHPTTGRTIGAGALARVAHHASAWVRAAACDGPVLVIEAEASFDAGAVADVLDGDDDWSLALLDGVAAYLITPAAAAELLIDEVLADAIPLPAVFGLDDAIEDEEPFVDHVVVLQVDDRRELLDAVRDLDPHALVVAVGLHHRVLAGLAELCSIYAQTADAMVLVAGTRHAPPALDAAALAAHPDPGTEYRYASALGVAGPAGAILDALAGRDEPDDDAAITAAYLDGMCAVDSACALFHVIDPAVGDAVAINGRVINGATGAWPAVVVAGSAATLDDLAGELAGGGSRDLGRVFRYDDAVDEGGDWRVVAADIVEVPFWTPEFCATIIRLAEAAEAWDQDADDPVPGAEVSLALLAPRLFAHVQTHVDARVMPALARVWPDMARTSLHDAFVIKYAVGGADELRLHHDIAQISASVRLCDTYRGGRLEFPRQGWHNGDVGVGRLVVWPSLVTHPHRSTPVEAGVKYGVTLWWKLPE